MDLGLDGRTALVTGGAGRIGSEDCRVFATEGADVVVLDVDVESAESVAEEIDADSDGGDGGSGGETVEAVGCDLTDREDVREMIEDVRAEFGGIDVLINNAAMVDARARMPDYDDEI
jgi:NAD(P)-dependent dehydrogenase (short-subunit alcohol dehydrogenase family)